MTTLAAIEQGLAQRCGPYRQDTVASATATTMVVNALRSSIELGGIADLFVLRRVANADDRVRIVKDYTPATGTVDVDRAWLTPPITGEMVEFHHLDPANELRPAALAGLRRCYVVERASVTLAGAASERDLSAQLPWLTDPGAVYDVAWAYPSDLLPPKPVRWWRAFAKDGGVWLATWPDPYPQTLHVTARRAVDSFVTGAPDDASDYPVPLDYAVAAAHVEAWRLFPYRLQPAAQTGLHANQEAAAGEFTRQARVHFRPPARRVMMPEPFGVSI